MCQPAVCKKCGKRTWRGCGQHVDQVMAGVPRSAQCTCAPEQGSALSTLKNLFRRG